MLQKSSLRIGGVTPLDIITTIHGRLQAASADKGTGEILQGRVMSMTPEMRDALHAEHESLAKHHRTLGILAGAGGGMGIGTALVWNLTKSKKVPLSNIGIGAGIGGVAGAGVGYGITELVRRMLANKIKGSDKYVGSVAIPLDIHGGRDQASRNLRNVYSQHESELANIKYNPKSKIDSWHFKAV